MPLVPFDQSNFKAAVQVQGDVLSIKALGISCLVKKINDLLRPYGHQCPKGLARKQTYTTIEVPRYGQQSFALYVDAGSVVVSVQRVIEEVTHRFTHRLNYRTGRSNGGTVVEWDDTENDKIFEDVILGGSSDRCHWVKEGMAFTIKCTYGELKRVLTICDALIGYENTPHELSRQEVAGGGVLEERL